MQTNGSKVGHVLHTSSTDDPYVWLPRPLQHDLTLHLTVILFIETKICISLSIEQHDSIKHESHNYHTFDSKNMNTQNNIKIIFHFVQNKNQNYTQQLKPQTTQLITQ